jgi:hypothetical protein
MRKSNLEARRNARRQAREAIASARRERAKKLAILTMIMEEESDEEHARTSKVPKARTRSSPLERARLNWSSFKEGKVRDGTFARTFRMDVPSFEKLESMLRPRLQKDNDMALRSSSGAIEPSVRLAITLRFLAGGSYLDLCDIYKCHRSTMYSVVWDTVSAINDHPDLALRWPSSREEVDANAAGFTKNTVFTGCVAAIDGLFVKKVAPSATETPHVLRYFNGHKMGYGINLQAACDARCRFVAASMNTPGSTNDYSAYLCSYIAELVEALPYGRYVVGDAAYPLSNKMLTPIPGTKLGVHEDAFNYFQSSMRITIERAFGILVARWGILWRPMRCSTAHCCAATQACLRLHNFCINHKAPLPGRRECALTALAQNENGTLFRDGTHFSTAPGPVTRSGGGSIIRGALVTQIVQRHMARPGHNVERNSTRIRNVTAV